MLWLEASKAYSDTCLFFLITAAALGYAACVSMTSDQRQAVHVLLSPLYWGSVVFGVMLGASGYIPFVCTGPSWYSLALSPAA